MCNDVNYVLAVAELKRKYGDEGEQKRALLNRLRKLRPISVVDTKKLRVFADYVNATVRSLDGLGVDSESYDATLKLQLLECIPGTLRTQWFLQEDEAAKKSAHGIAFLERHVAAGFRKYVTT